tara:strand:+ start:1851 stop:2393 length:543 start_codon:yes stop_codon:yes gene_type:complete
MKDKKNKLIDRLTEILDKPGGKQAARFALNSMGAIPFVGVVFAGAGDLWGEREQQIFNEKITEWATQANYDLETVLKMFESELQEPTKSNLGLLFGEALSLEIPFIIKSGTTYEVSTILHPQTLSEFEKFETTGWITITSNGNTTIMGVGNCLENSIEDKKRPRGMGNESIVRINESYYK